jgi:hypothetical protein
VRTRPRSDSRRSQIARLIAISLAAVGHLIARPAAAQARVGATLDSRDIFWSVELGAVGATRFVEDGNGVTTRAGLGPFLGAGVSVAIGNRVSLAAGVRGSTAALRVESSGSDWRAGRTHQYDLRIGIETGVARDLRLAASAFVARVTGPDDVIPFRSAPGRIFVWGGEVAGYVPLARNPYFDLLIAADVARVGSQSRENPPLAAGWVGRLRLGVRHGFP